MTDKKIELLTNVVGPGPEMSDNQIEMLMNDGALSAIATAKPLVRAASWRPTIPPPQAPGTNANGMSPVTKSNAYPGTGG